MASLKLIAVLGLVALLATAAYAVTCADDFNSCNAASFSGACYAYSGDSYCACRSGFTGASCQTDAATAGSCTLNSLNATKTEYPPINIAAFFDADVFSVTVRSPLVAQRNYSVVAIDDSAFDKKNCSYPGPNWARSVTSCEDVFVANLPWENNVECGWAADQSDVSFTKYSAQMVIRHHDVSVPFGSRPGADPVERIVDHLVPLTISFPKNITVSSDIVVQAPVKAIVAVSRQNVSADGANANVELTTNVLWPYTLNNFTILINPGGSGASYTPSLVSTSCNNDGVSSCTQVWRISIVNGANCNLNGDYSLQWTLDCQLVSGVKPPQCAIQSGDVVLAGLTTGSESFCTIVSTVLPLTGSLASYGDAGFEQNKTQFLVGQTLYYRASVVAPNITLTGTTINSVKLTSAGQNTVVLQAALVTQSAGTAGDFATISSNANSATFSFKLAGSFIDSIPDDSSRAFTTVVIVDVDYLNTVTLKRGVQRVEFTSNLNNQPLGLTAAFTVDKPAGGESAAASAALNLLVLFVALALAMAKLF